MLPPCVSVKFNRAVVIILLACTAQSFALNALVVTLGSAGHITPILELAKGMKNHNVTLLTQQGAHAYVNLNALRSPSFRILYVNDSPNALQDEKHFEQEFLLKLSGRSFLDAAHEVIPGLAHLIVPLLNKTLHVLMTERFDVVVAGKMVFGVPLLCEKSRTPCVIQSPSSTTSFFDFNLPNLFSSLSPDDLTQLKYRLYNVVFAARFLSAVIPRTASVFYDVFQSLPQVPGPFYDTYTLANIFRAKTKVLDLVSMPQTFYTPSYPDPYKKFVGALFDDTPAEYTETPLTRWVSSRPTHSIVYGAFGSTSVIPHDRMRSLVTGLAAFLLHAEGSYLLLALRSVNYDTYHAVLRELADGKSVQILSNKDRVRIENGFVPQKWILQQPSVKIFISHCGMGSCLEGLYCRKPILCMPFNMEQFTNAMRVDHLAVGQSLFVPSSRWESLLKPYDYARYTFTAEEVTNKTLMLWSDASYEKAAGLMSQEMKNSGGVKRAVQEIEFFVELNGDLDRFAPFQSTLPLYQRYCVDLLLVLVVLPTVLVVYLLKKCCRRQRKTKMD